MSALVTILGGIRATVFACAALLLGVLLWMADARYDALVRSNDTALATAREIARQREDAMLGVIWDVAYDAETKRIQRERTTDATIACLRDGTCRLRDRFTCPRVPTASTTAAGGDDQAAGGLRLDDTEFLVRFADRADAVADQLSSCQAVITGYLPPESGWLKELRTAGVSP